MMIGILLYHFMVYNGVIYIPENDFTVPGLLICSGSAIVADYAFMSLTAYFMIDEKKRPIGKKIIKTLCPVVFMYAIKNIILFGLLGYRRDIGFYSDFFIDGSWWFIYVYFVILFMTPILNRIIYKAKVIYLQLICVGLMIAFIRNGITNDVNLINDLIGFLLVYFVIGYLKRVKFSGIDGYKYAKQSLLAIFCIGYIITFAISYFVRISDVDYFATNANSIIQHLVGKYAFLQFVMGVSVFLLFRMIEIPYNKWINNIAEHMLYVFLLHETVLAIFWDKGLLRTIDNKLPFSNGLEFMVCCVGYIVAVFVFAMFVKYVFDKIKELK